MSTQASIQRTQLEEETSAIATSEVMVDLLDIQLNKQKRLLEDKTDACATAEAVAQPSTP